jgi:hypothetical protein
MGDPAGTIQGNPHMNENELVGDFVYLCETNGLDPEQALRILNAQYWHEGHEHVIRFPEGLRIWEDAEEIAQ